MMSLMPPSHRRPGADLSKPRVVLLILRLMLPWCLTVSADADRRDRGRTLPAICRIIIDAIPQPNHEEPVTTPCATRAPSLSNRIRRRPPIGIRLWSGRGGGLYMAYDVFNCNEWQRACSSGPISEATYDLTGCGK